MDSVLTFLQRLMEAPEGQVILLIVFMFVAIPGVLMFYLIKSSRQAARDWSDLAEMLVNSTTQAAVQHGNALSSIERAIEATLELNRAQTASLELIEDRLLALTDVVSASRQSINSVGDILGQQAHTFDIMNKQITRRLEDEGQALQAVNLLVEEIKALNTKQDTITTQLTVLLSEPPATAEAVAAHLRPHLARIEETIHGWQRLLEQTLPDTTKQMAKQPVSD